MLAFLAILDGSSARSGEHPGTVCRESDGPLVGGRGSVLMGESALPKGEECHVEHTGHGLCRAVQGWRRADPQEGQYRPAPPFEHPASRLHPFLRGGPAMKTITRAQAIEDIRKVLVAITGDEHSVCEVAARLGLF